MNSIQVSIVIVCMNNLKNLYPCLNSIRKNTTVSCETLVVAYLFSKENLEMVKHDFPWVTFIESNEIRGFSENNNLALRQAKGKYCFVVNDDTILLQGTIDYLVDAFDSSSDNVAIISPLILDRNKKIAVCGRPPMNWYTYLLSFLRIRLKKDRKWTNGSGLFRSYNILGAAFMIKTEIFKNVGWFDEYYFFSPEDIALSTKLNKIGYECWVETKSKIIHLEGMTGGQSISIIKTATLPAGRKGLLHFYSEGKWYLYIVVWIIIFLSLNLEILYHFVKSIGLKKPNVYSVLSLAERNSLKMIFSKKTPKQIFIYYYKLIKK